MSSSLGKLFSPPLVSVIVTNYNYGRFLRDAVDSVFAQTYPHIECIIVDDASTDESPAILAEIVATRPTAKTIRKSLNGGQLAAALDGFAASTGDYVLFLDLDDFLLDQCIATHVFVNLSLRRPVGFTCSDMIQVVGDRLVVGSHSYLSHYICSTASATPVRPIAEAVAGSWTSTGLDPSVLHRLHSVDMTYRGWAWSATSGFFFRRDALSFWTRTPGLAELRRSTDSFFGRAVNALTGSVIIDQPLSAWRIHGANTFCKHAHLGELRNFDFRKSWDLFTAACFSRRSCDTRPDFRSMIQVDCGYCLRRWTHQTSRPGRRNGRDRRACPTFSSRTMCTSRNSSARMRSSSGCGKKESPGG